MNERFKELAIKARIQMCSDARLEEYGELILQDVFDVLRKWKSEPFPFDEDTAVSLIKEHFNIKG